MRKVRQIVFIAMGFEAMVGFELLQSVSIRVLMDALEPWKFAVLPFEISSQHSSPLQDF